MTRSKVSAFFQEFKFLQKLFNEGKVQEVRVSRVNEETADNAPEYQSLKTELVNGLGETIYVHAWKSIFLLDNNGHQLSEVGIESEKCNFLGLFKWEERTRISETVAGAIARLGNKAKDVYYVVVSEPIVGPLVPDNAVFLPSEVVSILNNLMLLKSPKGYDVKSWFEEVHRRDAEEVKTTLANIDQV